MCSPAALYVALTVLRKHVTLVLYWGFQNIMQIDLRHDLSCKLWQVFIHYLNQLEVVVFSSTNNCSACMHSDINCG